jgi:hypothetical protein
MKRLTNSDHVERVFMHADLTELPALLDRAQLIVRMRQVQNGTAPAKRTPREPRVRTKVPGGGTLRDRAILGGEPSE